LLNARFLIYRHKYEKSKPTVAAFIQTINCVKITEKRIARKNGKLKQHFENGILCIGLVETLPLVVFDLFVSVILLQKKI